MFPSFAFLLSLSFFLLPGLVWRRSITYLLRPHRRSFIFDSTNRFFPLKLSCVPCYRLVCSSSFQLNMHSLPARSFAWIGSPPFIFIHHSRRTLFRFFYTSFFADSFLFLRLCTSILQPFRPSFFLHLCLLSYLYHSSFLSTVFFPACMHPFRLHSPSASFFRTLLHLPGLFSLQFVHF